MAAPGDLELVRDFVNTLDVLPSTEEFEDPACLARWLAEHRLIPAEPVLDEEDLARAKSLREALREMLLANAGFPFPAEADGLDHAVGRLVSVVFEAQEDGNWSRLKACAECHWALYDHTRNHSAAWCGSQCGSRVRTRRHRKRRRADPA